MSKSDKNKTKMEQFSFKFSKEVDKIKTKKSYKDDRK